MATHDTVHFAVTPTGHTPDPPVRSGNDRQINVYPHGGTTDRSTTGPGGADPNPPHVNAATGPPNRSGLSPPGSPIDHTVEVTRAVAVPDNPPALTVAVNARGSSIHNHTGTFTATTAGSGPICTNGVGTANNPVASCANSIASGGGATGAAGAPFAANTNPPRHVTPSGRPGTLD